MKSPISIALLFVALINYGLGNGENSKTRVLVTSDGEVDDECSLVRFLLYSNEWDVEGIITSSSQYHWQGHRWNGDDWAVPYLEAYAEVYPNLILHDPDYPSPEYLKSVTLLGNVAAEGEMDFVTPGSQHIVKILLDESDNRPIWLQAWGGTNTIARALKTIEEDHPDKMKYVAGKLRFFLIWEQDSTFQSYIRPHWGKYNLLTIICYSFWAMAYEWNKIIPSEKIEHFKVDWMIPNILENHGPLCSLYQAYKGGDDNEGWASGSPKQRGSFRSEGDSPAFIYAIPTGLGFMESPNYGNWGGRYVNVRENIWLDPVPEPGYTYPEGRWYTKTAWGRNYMRNTYPDKSELKEEYFRSITRWTDALQNDFAARADWCVLTFDEANHQPVVKINREPIFVVKPGDSVQISAKESYDPDNDELSYHWWQYCEASSFKNKMKISNAFTSDVTVTIPHGIVGQESIHLICEVKDSGVPQLTRYKRVVLNIIP